MRCRKLRWSRGWVMRPDGLVLVAERRQRTSFWVPVCLILAQCMSSGAYAQQSRDSSTLDHSASLEEIVVTAEKRSSTVQTTPVSITAITGEDLRSMGVSSAQGLAAEVPGLAISSSGPGQAQYEIRGMTADAGEASTIGFYLDEIPITPPTTATNGKVAIDPDLYDLARVEVLRGPQGTLYGAGSMGGTVKLVTTPPDPNAFYGSSDTIVSGTDRGGVNYGQKAMLNFPLIEDLAALRLVGTYTHTSGWIDRIVVPNFPLQTNPTPGYYGSVRGNLRNAPRGQVYRGVNDESLESGRASLLVEPNEFFSLFASVMYQRTAQGGMSNYDSDPGTLAHYEPFNIAEPYSDQFLVYDVTAALTLTPFTVTSATGYWTRKSIQIQDATEATQNGFMFPTFSASGGLGIGPASSSEVDSTRQFSQEIRLASNTEGRLRWLLGGFYSKYDFTVHTAETVPGFATVDGGAFGISNVFDGISPLTLIQRALFGNLSYRLTDQLTATVGARYFSFSNTVESLYSGIFFGTTDTSIATSSAAATGTNPMANLSYSPNKNLLLYATAAKGFREGAGNFPVPTTGVVGSTCLQSLQAIGRTSAPLAYAPDTVWSYELGEKLQLMDKKLTINGDIFYMKWSKVQTPVALSCGVGFTDNAADVGLRGGELEVHAKLLPQLTLIQNVGYVHAAYIDAAPGTGIVVGQSPTNVPKWTISTILKFEQPLYAETRAVAQVTNSYVSSMHDLTYTLNTIPSRDTTGFRAGVEGHAWSAVLFIDNVLNKRQVLSAINLLAPFGPTYNRLATNQPLTMGIDASFRF